jgi:phosphate starvation-inducible protein PhoH and related proteins
MSKKRQSASKEQVQDRSPTVHQRTILKDPVELRELPWTEKQKQFIELATNRNVEVLLVKGVAGTSKTASAIFCALQLLNSKKISDIILVRSIVESSDNKMGYLPGNADEKLYPYLVPFFDKLDMFVNKNDLQRIQKEERITAFPLSFLRGMDWNRKAIVLDEAQNTTRKELLTFLTRIGRFCKTFVIGDPSQADIKNSGFEEVFDLFNNEDARSHGVYCFEFGEEDVMRSDLCKFVAKKFKELSEKPLIPKKKSLPPANGIDWVPNAGGN